jgi:hypothetical protein
MALITCPDCKKEISSSAVNCPNCGYPIAKAIETKSKAISKKDKRLGCIITVCVLIVIIIIVGLCNRNNSTNNKSIDTSTVDLKVSVTFTGTQFVITNNDNFNYLKVKMELNDDYYLYSDVIEAGKVYTVGMLQFADKKGNRFDIMQKPLSFSISCKLPGGTDGFYFGSWK